MHLFSDISATAFLEMSIYFERKFFSDPKFYKVFCSYLEMFYLLTSTIVNNSVQLDVSGDNDNFSRFTAALSLKSTTTLNSMLDCTFRNVLCFD